MRLLLAGSLLLAPAVAGDEYREYKRYRQAIVETAAMVANSQAQQLAKDHGLQILNVTWEDTARYKNSAVGPNISDMTIQVQLMHPRTERFELFCMPVIRYPNFVDKTGDVPIDKFHLWVGNQRGAGLRRVTLREYLRDIRGYLSNPCSWKGKGRSLLAPRDDVVLVSAQACFLPIPARSKATFNPVLFNYQSYKNHPAVLAILCTSHGTSATVIDNVRDGFQAGRTWGQRLFFNCAGLRASLTGMRIRDFGPLRKDGRHEPPRDHGLNVVLLIQVPLKHEPLVRVYGEGAPTTPGGAAGKARSNVEDAVIGHGRVEGRFTEIDNLAIERDPRFPLRVTVQFYKATDNGVVDEGDMREIAREIERVYKDALRVGSLVTGSDAGRRTAHDGDKIEPPGWWAAFWRRHFAATGQDPWAAMAMLRSLFGPNWRTRPEREILDALIKGGFPAH